MSSERHEFLLLEPPPSRPTNGGGIVDLAASIASRFGAGARSSLSEPAFDAALAESRCVVLLLFDGFGERQVDTLVPGGALACARRTVLRSVFPSSTAPAITSFASARHPSVHGVPGWFCWSEELGAIVRSLPMDLRGARDTAVEPAVVWDWRSASEGFAVPVHVIQPDFIAESAYSRHAWSGATRAAYHSSEELVGQVETAVRRMSGGGFVWAYLPEFDSICHEHGWRSDAAAAVARRFDGLFARLADRLRDTGALLLATADHGFIDVPAERQLRLADFPEVSRHLSRPLSGEPRVVFCQAREGEHDAFGQAARASLGFAFDVVPSASLLAAGWFGPVDGPSRLLARLGSHTLIGRDCHTLVDSVPGEIETRFIGMHGGTTCDEMCVPLAAVLRGSPL